MANKIKVLDGLVASKIAAGEVIERPASVVKELLENALDSGATAITLRIKEGGRSLIAVSDNGCGINAEDAPLAILRHATSKIGLEEDLLRVKTLGFRGEALASIAAISRLTITTRTHDSATGARLHVEGGGAPVITPAGCNEGTSVEVRDLFFNTPVRLQFLRSPQTESGRIMDVFKTLALVNPGVRFSVVRDIGRDMILPVCTQSERLMTISALPAEKEGHLMALLSPHLEGYIGTAELSYTTARSLYTYLNGRPIKDRAVGRAVIDGYGRLLERPRYPLVLINLRIPPSDVDVNIHPAKTEVRFKNPGSVYNLVRDAIRKALATEGTGTVASVFYSQPNTSANNALPVMGERAAEPWQGRRGVQAGGAGRTVPLFTRVHDEGVKNPEFLGLRVLGQIWDEFLLAESCVGGDDEDGIFYIIDQHGAEERGAYERIKKSFLRGGLQSQLLLMPERIEASAEESEALRGATERLGRLGFEVAPFGPSAGGGESFIIKSIPQILPPMEAGPMIKALAAEISTEGGSALVEDVLDKALMTIACHSVIRGARSLTTEEGDEVLRGLASMDFAGYCPHGRPVVRRFKRKEIEGFFKR